MKGNKTAIWIPILIIGVLILIGLGICVAVVLSLIPVYINNKSVAPPNATETVYTVGPLNFGVGGSTGRRRSVRNSDFPAPSTVMIQSIQSQCNSLFAGVGGTVIISQVQMLSVQLLTLTLKIYFKPGCLACKKKHRGFIKKILKKKLTFNIFMQYSTDCSSEPISVGMVPIKLRKDKDNSGSSGGSKESGENNNIDSLISEPVQTLLSSLIPQVSFCGTELELPKDCKKPDSSDTLADLSVNEISDKDDCYYFITDRETTKVDIEFTFSSVFEEGYFGIGKIFFMSTSNAVVNGDFDAKDPVTMDPSTEPWVIEGCGASCLAEVNDGNYPDFKQSFICSGESITIRQTINLKTVGRRTIYRLKFSLAYKSTPPAPGLLKIKIKPK